MPLEYSSLKEAFGIKKSKEQFKNKDANEDDKKSEIKETLIDYANHDDCYYKKYGVNMESCKEPPKVVNKYATDFCDNFTNYNSNDVTNNNSSQNNKANCSPLQAPNYEYPISDESKKKYQEALKISMNENKPVSYDEFNRRCKMNNIQPYEDDDIDRYLNLNNFKNDINYQPKQQTDNKTENEQNNKQLSSKKNTDNKSETILKPEDKTYVNYNKNVDINTDKDKKLELSENKNKLYSTYINIGLFIFIGIAIILLCDQIAEIAINIGMRKTARLLEPYLNKLQDINNYERTLTQQPSYQVQNTNNE
jgi:hypothetical protein